MARSSLSGRVRGGGVRTVALLIAALATMTAAAAPAGATEGYRAITGSGSTWSANMVEQWTSDVRQFGISVGFSAVGSSAGRNEFRNGTVDFAVSEIPYGLSDAQGTVDTLPERGFAYLPIVAGGTSFMYNLKVAGQQVTNLRLSGDTVARIFTGAITKWDDAAILEDNPNLALPNRDIVPVVRSDGSGTTAQFTQWMSKQHPAVWNSFCQQQGIGSGGGCGFTSFFPAANGFISQAGSLGVSGYVSQPTAEGAITYVEYSYAKRNRFPVVMVQNASGYYIEPTDEAVAVSLLKAEIETTPGDTYLTQKLDGVYTDTDPRSYPLSSYSYMIIPTAEAGTFRSDKGRALGDFLYYSICEGQQNASTLGYSPLPQNLVLAGFEQIRLIPGVVPENVNLASCRNPTFSSDGTNTLANTAPQPRACAREGTFQCAEGTGGAADIATAVTRGTGPPVEGGVGGGAEGGAGGGSGGGGGGGDPGGGGGANDGAGGVVPGGTASGPAAVDPAALGDSAGGTLIDPETGEIIGANAAGAGGAGGVSAVSGIPVSAPGGSGWTTQHTLMVLAALSLLAATVGPPLIGRRLAGERQP